MSDETEMRARFATVKKIAELYDVHERTVRRWCVNGEVKAELLPSSSRWRIRVNIHGEPLRP